MIELSIPQFGEDTKNVKDLVFTILTTEQPLSIIELSNRIRKSYNVSVTYQAVRKAIDTLHSQGVLIKAKKKYSIDRTWALKLKSFFDNLLATYECKTTVKLFNTELAKEDYAVYTLNSLFDLDNFWGDVQMYWADHEKTNRNFYSYTYYNWWMLINLGRETKHFEQFRSKKINLYCIFRNKFPLNLWAEKVYKDLGAKTVIKAVKDEEQIVDINILGDTVVQVKYPKKIIGKVKEFYRRYKNTSEMSLKEITQIVHEPCDIKLIMFKNPTIAQNLRESYMRMF